MEIHPNILATILLAGYPLFALALFLVFRPQVAVLVSLLVGDMFLPPAYILPIHPAWFGREAISAFTVFFLALVFARRYLRRSRPFRGIELAFACLLFGFFFTWLTNRDPLQVGPKTYLPQVFSDFIADAAQLLWDPWVLFFLGRVMFKTSRDLITLHRLTTLAMAIYTLPILFEIRMSPQICARLYGYFSTGQTWGMTYRWGGYRPLVLFPSGLHLASFVLTCTVMTIAATRARIRVGALPMRALSLYLVAVLVLCKSTGAIVYAALLVPIVALGSSRLILNVAKAVTIFFVAYPFLRAFDLLPTDAIGNFFAGLSPDRADSLDYRFNMERGLLDRVSLRPWWGWGGYGRGWVHDETSGVSLSVPDGAMIINLVTHGWVSLVCYYAPFVYAILRAPRFIRKIRSRSDRLLLSGLAVVCSAILVDLIFNTSFFPTYLLLFGALYGLSSGIVAEEAKQRQAEMELRVAEEGFAA